jgi:hypothetical protein
MPNMVLIEGSWFWLIARRRAKAAGRCCYNVNNTRSSGGGGIYTHNYQQISLSFRRSQPSEVLCALSMAMFPEVSVAVDLFRRRANWFRRRANVISLACVSAA